MSWVLEVESKKKSKSDDVNEYCSKTNGINDENNCPFQKTGRSMDNLKTLHKKNKKPRNTVHFI